MSGRRFFGALGLRRAFGRVFLLPLFLVACPERAPSRATVARCGFVTGDVRFRPRLSSAWEAAAAGTDLSTGDWVQTAEEAWARIDFQAGAKLSMQPRSIVVIEERKGRPDPTRVLERVSIRTGVVRGVMTSTAAMKELVLGTPDGKEFRLVPIPGAGDLDYRVTVGEGGRVEVAVTRGLAEIRDGEGSAVLLSHGHARDLREGVVVGDVIELLPYPALSSPGIDATVTFRSELRVEMTWSPIPSAGGYVVEVARDQSFAWLSHATTTKGTTWTFEPKAPGDYFWRVASRTHDGREGEFGFARRLLVTETRANDLLVAPKDGAIIGLSGAKPSIRFSWRAVEPPAQYLLVVARDGLLERPVLSRRTLAQDYESSALGAGEYYWGVYAERGGAREPLFSTPRRLLVGADRLRLRVPSELKWQ